MNSGIFNAGIFNAAIRTLFPFLLLPFPASLKHKDHSTETRNTKTQIPVFICKIHKNCLNSHACTLFCPASPLLPFQSGPFWNWPPWAREAGTACRKRLLSFCKVLSIGQDSAKKFRKQETHAVGFRKTVPAIFMKIDHGKMPRIGHIGIWSVLTVALVLGTCLADEESGEKHKLYLRRPARVRFVMLLNFQ